MTGDGFSDILNHFKTIQPDNHGVSFDVKLGLSNREYDCFYVGIEDIDCKPEYVVIAIESYMWNVREVLYIPYDSILGIVQERYSNGASDFELLIRDEVLRALRAKYEEALLKESETGSQDQSNEGQKNKPLDAYALTR